MAGIRVVTDSACDLPQALADQHGIEIVPLTIRFGDTELVDRRDLSPKEFWARSAESPVLPETAAPSAGAFEEMFKRVAGDGADGIVCVTLSSALSATHQAAALAAKSLGDDIPIRVVDSKAVTMAQGLMALAAAKLGEQGSSIDECAQAVEDLVARSRIFATLDTLENLKKGGRIGAAQALFGSLLSIKPVIELRDGVVEAESKQRTRSKSLRYLVEKVKEHGKVENLVVMHGEAPDLEEFLDLVSAVYPRDDLIVGDIGAVIGTHGGPRVMGVVFHVPR
ncbi:MAG: fatty acid kinase fatty acid binding subunit [Actinomycetota bacterium]|jgi:DegV family protein with EDD domain